MHCSHLICPGAVITLPPVSGLLWLIVRRCPFPSGNNPIAMWGRDKMVHKASRQKHQWVASITDGGAMTASPAPKPSLWCPSQSTCGRRQEI